MRKINVLRACSSIGFSTGLVTCSMISFMDASLLDSAMAGNAPVPVPFSTPPVLEVVNGGTNATIVTTDSNGNTVFDLQTNGRPTGSSATQNLDGSGFIETPRSTTNFSAPGSSGLSGVPGSFQTITTTNSGSDFRSGLSIGIGR